MHIILAGLARWARLLVVTAAGLAVGCDNPAGSSPEPSDCRRAPAVLDVNGTRHRCSFGGGTFSCSAGISATRQTTWGSVDDFVREKHVVGLILAREHRTTSNSLGGGSASTTSLYEHDAEGRLFRRTRTGTSAIGGSRASEVYDVTTFTTWDALGRPTRAIVRDAEDEEEVSMSYDEAARLTRWSNGELVRQDQDGNVLVHIRVFRTSRRSFRHVEEITVLASTEVCR